MIESLLHLIIG